MKRITAENNLLHRQLIAAKEAADEQQRQHAAGTRDLEAQLNQSSLLTAAAGERAAAAERTCEGLKRRLAEVARLQRRYEQGRMAPLMVAALNAATLIECSHCLLLRRAWTLIAPGCSSGVP